LDDRFGSVADTLVNIRLMATMRTLLLIPFVPTHVKQTRIQLSGDLLADTK